MVTFREAVADALGSAACAVIAVNDDAVKLFGRIAPPLAGAADYANFFAPLRTQFCNDDPADYVPPSAPYQGGECPINYNAFWETRVFQSGVGYVWQARSRTGVQMVGPIAIDPGQDLPGCGPGEQYANESAVPSRGVPFLIGTGGCTDIKPSYRNLQFLPSDGLPPDPNCDPPIPQPEPGPVERPINITFDTDIGGTVNVSGDVVFSPAFSTGDFNIRVPFSLDLGGFTWIGDLQLAPSFDLEISPVFRFGNGGSADPDPIAPRNPSDPEPPEPEPGEPAIIGVIVRSVLIGEQRQTSIATTGQPTIFAPRLGSVSFAINAGLVSAWTPDIDVKNRDCYVPCPAPQGAVAVSASPVPGVEMTFVPVRGRPLLDLSS